MKDDFLVKSSSDTISIKADPAIIDDIIRVLDAVLSIAHVIKRKAKYENAIAQEKREKETALRRAQFEAKAVNIYRRFKYLLEKDCNGSKPLAMQILKEEFQMGYTEVDIYVAEGRKVLRAREKARQGK